MVLVDTSILSLILRRKRQDLALHEQIHAIELERLMSLDQERVIGPVRQEVLTGIREVEQFQKVKTLLKRFVDEPLVIEDFEHAAELCNRCRKHGIAGSSVDFLICAVSLRIESPIFSTDRDFHNYSKYIPITLHEPASPSTH